MAIICRTKRYAAALTAKIGSNSTVLTERFVDGDNLIDRVRVGLPTDFADDAFAISRRHIVLFPDALFAIREAALDIFANRSNRFRFFGFCEREASFAVTQEAYIRGTFGFHEICIPHHGYVQTPVRFLFYGCHSPQMKAPAELWLSRHRNRTVASIANKLRDYVDREGSPHSSVVVLTGSIDHAIRLGRLMPSWPIVVANAGNPVGLSSDDLARITAGISRDQLSDRIIATHDGLSRLSPPVGDAYVVWAGGGDFGPVLPHRYLVGPFPWIGAAERRTYLLDFGDLGPSAVHARKRKRGYLRQGYVPAHQNEVDARVHAFIARHKGGAMSISTFVPARTRPYSFAEHGRSEIWTNHWAVKCRRSQPRTLTEMKAPFELVADHNRLFEVYREIKATGGQAPGADGLRYDDLSDTEIARLLRGVAEQIRGGTYRPHSHRTVRIPKGGGRHRVLHLRSILDRVVSTAIYRQICPLIDPILMDGVYGFRPRRSVYHMLIAIERAVIRQGRHWIMTDDIRDAFPTVGINDVMAVFRDVISDRELLDLIRRVLQGHDCNRKVGIDQGDALSPIALNLLLHNALDTPLTAACGGTTGWHRYADNVVVTAPTRPECWSAIQAANNALTSAEMTLRGEMSQPVSLQRQGTKVEILGFMASLGNGRLKLSPGRKAWDHLRLDLSGLWATPYPAERARQVVRGWIDAYGPALENAERPRARERILTTTVHLGFREGITGPIVDDWMRRSHIRWLILRHRIDRHVSGSLAQ